MNDNIRHLCLWSMVNIKVVAMILFACSCSQMPEKNDHSPVSDPDVERQIIKKPSSSYSDTIEINNQSAVFYNPDSLQMEKIKAVNKKMVYETITHDCYYQMQNARNVIRQYWPGVHIVEVVKARYLLFIKEDRTKVYIDLNSKNDICGLFLFDPKKDPELVDMPNIDTFLGFYFGK